MEVKITPFNIEGEQGQTIEFNVTIPKGARTDVAPQSTLSAATRYSVVYDAALGGSPLYRQVTKFELVHTLMYTDCNNKQQALVNRYSTIVDIPVNSDTAVTLTPIIFKVVDVLIPYGSATVNQATITNTPTELPRKANCSYSVFTFAVADTTPVPSVN